jgi:hypothetical protein
MRQRLKYSTRWEKSSGLQYRPLESLQLRTQDEGIVTIVGLNVFHKVAFPLRLLVL